jgi:hypothetical protein
MTIYTRADIYRFSFFPHTIITWNSIPLDVRQASTIGQWQVKTSVHMPNPVAHFTLVISYSHHEYSWKPNAIQSICDSCLHILDERVLFPKHETSMIIHNLVEIRAEHLLIPSDCRTRGIVEFMTIYTRADIYRFSFFLHTIITWNSIVP